MTTESERRRYRRALVMGVVLEVAVLAMLAAIAIALVMAVAWMLRG